VARRVFHTDTCALLQRLDEAARTTAFIDAWTQREAHVKAVGGGLFHTPDLLPFDAGQPVDATVSIVRERNGDAEWSIARLAPVADARASVVVSGAIETVRVHGAGETLTIMGG
jgi:4'-phosphopantetheinyl transferase